MYGPYAMNSELHWNGRRLPIANARTRGAPLTSAFATLRRLPGLRQSPDAHASPGWVDAPWCPERRGANVCD
jgi:hypothetical protein